MWVYNQLVFWQIHLELLLDLELPFSKRPSFLAIYLFINSTSSKAQCLDITFMLGTCLATRSSVLVTGWCQCDKVNDGIVSLVESWFILFLHVVIAIVTGGTWSKPFPKQLFCNSNCQLKVFKFVKDVTLQLGTYSKNDLAKDFGSESNTIHERQAQITQCYI